MLGHIKIAASGEGSLSPPIWPMLGKVLFEWWARLSHQWLGIDQVPACNDPLGKVSIGMCRGYSSDFYTFNAVSEAPPSLC